MGRPIPFCLIHSGGQHIAELSGIGGKGGRKVSNPCNSFSGHLKPAALCSWTRGPLSQNSIIQTKRSRPCDALSSHRIRSPQERAHIKGRVVLELQPNATHVGTPSSLRPSTVDLIRRDQQCPAQVGECALGIQLSTHHATTVRQEECYPPHLIWY